MMNKTVFGKAALGLVAAFNLTACDIYTRNASLNSCYLDRDQQKVFVELGAFNKTISIDVEETRPAQYEGVSDDGVAVLYNAQENSCYGQNDARGMFGLKYRYNVTKHAPTL